MPLKIIRDFDKGERVLPDEALKLGACTLKEINDAIRKDGYETYHSALPVWTSTHIEYKAGATEALVWNEGEKKKTKIKLPLQDGWYLPDKKWGIPNGEKSSESNPDAMYLWRRQNDDYSGLLVRDCGFDDWDRRVVIAYGDSDARLGVIESVKSKWKGETMKCDRKGCGCDRKGCGKEATELVSIHEVSVSFCDDCWELVDELINCMKSGKCIEIYIAEYIADVVEP